MQTMHVRIGSWSLMTGEHFLSIRKILAVVYGRHVSFGPKAAFLLMLPVAVCISISIEYFAFSLNTTTVWTKEALREQTGFWTFRRH